jgi:hypothetical protein
MPNAAFICGFGSSRTNFGKRRKAAWRMTEDEAKHYKDAVKVDGSLEIRRSMGSSGDFQRSRE